MPRWSRTNTVRCSIRFIDSAALLAGALLIFAVRLQAAGSTSAAFLQLGAGARSAGMGDAYVAVADDASSTHWNPAGMSRLAKNEFLAEHAMHVQGIGIERLAAVHPFARRGAALGVSGTVLHLNGIEARSGNTAAPDRFFGASDFAGAVSVSWPLSARAGLASSVGVTGKVIQQRIDAFSASAYAADFGVQQQVGRFRLGAVAANVGSSVRFIDQSYPLPTAIRLGLSYQTKSLPLTLAAGAEKVRSDSGLAYRAGTEYAMGSLLAFRLGYLARPGSGNHALKGAGLGTVNAGELSRLTGVVGGLGFRLLGYSVDYAFAPYGDLGNSHKFTVSARF